MMITTTLLTLALVFGLAPFQYPGSTPPPLGPGGTTPQVGTVEAIREGNLVFRELVMVPETKTVTVAEQQSVEVNGRQETRTVTKEIVVTQMTARANMINVPLAKVKAFDLDGRAIPTSRLAALFPRPSLVLYSNEGVTVDPAYLKVARPGVIFIVMPMRVMEP